MHALPATVLLDLWEAGQADSPARRALALLAAAGDEAEAELARLSIGARDRRLLELRAALFGPELDVVAHCPACRERLEFTLPVAALILPEAVSAPVPRAPTSRDLLAIANVADPAEARLRLLERCVDGPLPEDAAARATLEQQISAADPQADLSIDLGCGACDHRWEAPFDPLAFLWSEIDDWAHRTLLEIHHLATAYGWNEREILALPARRRRRYLEMVIA